MVTPRIVSRFTGPPQPVGNGAARKITGGPLYPVDEVLRVISQGGSSVIHAWTQKCTQDMQKWSLDTDDLLELIGISINKGRFIGSEWCEQKPNGPWAACDAYTVNRKEWIPATHREIDLEYYVKFAIGKTGVVLLVVSCHPPEERR